MDTALLKLKQMLASRYGKGFELRPLMDLSKLGRGSNEPVVHGNDLYIPIVVQEQFLGTAVIPHGWELEDENKRGIAQLVRMVLEPKLYNDFLERRELNLRSVHSLSFVDSNLALFGGDLDVPEAEEDFEKRNPTTCLIHLQGKSPQITQKVAFQIHEFSGRWAFVPFSDLSKDLHSTMDLCNLGGMTLFVENVETLSVEHQNLLADYLSSPRSLEEPLILTSSTLPILSLKDSIANESLAEDMLGVHIEVERAPLNSKILREMMDLFFQPDTQDLH